MADDNVTVKGSPVRSLQKFVDQQLTKEEREKVLSALPEPFARRLRAPILPTETIPVHWLNRLTEEAAAIKAQPVADFGRMAGREAATDAVRGIYRFFALALTPAALMSRAGQMWTALYNRGRIEIADQTDHSCTIKLLDFPSELAGCARTTGWIERLAELTGVKNVRIEQTQCFAKGDSHCEWKVAWE